MARFVLKGQETKIRELYWDKQFSITQIARHFNVARGTVQGFMERHNIPRDTNRLSGFVKERSKGVITQEVIALYKQNLPVRAVGEKLNISHSAVRYHLKKAGYPLRSISDAVWLAIQQKRGYIGGKGEFNPRWRGGKTKNHEGYVLVYSPNHPRKHRDQYVFEHILVWEKTHGQPLPAGWVIHHLDGIKDDNRPENLVACPSRRHYDFIKALQTRIAALENGG